MQKGEEETSLENSRSTSILRRKYKPSYFPTDPCHAEPVCTDDLLAGCKIDTHRNQPDGSNELLPPFKTANDPNLISFFSRAAKPGAFLVVQGNLKSSRKCNTCALASTVQI